MLTLRAYKGACATVHLLGARPSLFRQVDRSYLSWNLKRSSWNWNSWILKRMALLKRMRSRNNEREFHETSWSCIAEKNGWNAQSCNLFPMRESYPFRDVTCISSPGRVMVWDVRGGLQSKAEAQVIMNINSRLYYGVCMINDIDECSILVIMPDCSLYPQSDHLTDFVTLATRSCYSIALCHTP